MLVQCPGCRTTYRVSDNAITSPNPTFRCSRCKHIFVTASKNETKSLAKALNTLPATGEQEEENREFSFSFPSQKKGEEEKRESYGSPEAKNTSFDQKPDEQKPASTEARAGESLFIPQEKPVIRTTDDSMAAGQDKDTGFEPTEQCEDSGSIRSSEDRDDGRFVISDESQSIQTQIAAHTEPEPNPSPPSQEDKTAFPGFEPQVGQPLSTVPYLTLFGCLLLIFSILTFAHQVQPRRIDSFLKRIPWFGAGVFRNSHLRNGITLQSVRPSIQKLMENREVFVVAGVAANHNLTGVRQVRIEGRAYSAEGKEIERQTIAVGNAISEKIIRDMTARDLSILQKLESRKRFEIGPEESANFALVFLKPTKEIKTFSCRVVSAEEAS